MGQIHNCNVFIYYINVKFCHFLYVSHYKKVIIPDMFVLPVTSQPGVGRGSSIQGVGRYHLEKIV